MTPLHNGMLCYRDVGNQREVRGAALEGLNGSRVCDRGEREREIRHLLSKGDSAHGVDLQLGSLLSIPTQLRFHLCDEAPNAATECNLRQISFHASIFLVNHLYFNRISPRH